MVLGDFWVIFCDFAFFLVVLVILGFNCRACVWCGVDIIPGIREFRMFCVAGVICLCIRYVWFWCFGCFVVLIVLLWLVFVF